MDDEDVFAPYTISDNWKLLDTIKDRTPCPLCRKSRKYFCYTCYVPVPRLRDVIPQISLPIKIDIIKHKREIDGKSTSAHAAILAPEDVTIWQYPDDITQCTFDEQVIIPNSVYIEIMLEIVLKNYDFTQTILIYPGKKSYSLEEYFQKNPVITSSFEEDEKDSGIDSNKGKFMIDKRLIKLPFNRAVFVDGTWNQSKAMYGCLRNLPCIVLQSRLSQFWRHQKNSPRWYLSTIEAIHQLLSETREYCCNVIDYVDTEPKDFDNLLFFFRHMYQMINSYYDHNLLLSYRRPLNL